MFAAVCGWVDEQSAFRVITQLSACMPLRKWKVLSHTLLWCIIVISATVVINHGKCFPNRRARCRRSSVWSSFSSSSVLLLSRPPVVFAPHHLSRLHHLSRFIFPLLLYVQGENFIPLQSYVSMIERKSWEPDGDGFGYGGGHLNMWFFLPQSQSTFIPPSAHFSSFSSIFLLLKLPDDSEVFC